MIDDFRRTLLDERESKVGGQGKGHAIGLRVVKEQLAGGAYATSLTESALHTSAVALAAVESLLTGGAAKPVSA